MFRRNHNQEGSFSLSSDQRLSKSQLKAMKRYSQNTENKTSVSKCLAFQTICQKVCSKAPTPQKQKETNLNELKNLIGKK